MRHEGDDVEGITVLAVRPPSLSLSPSSMRGGVIMGSSLSSQDQRTNPDGEGKDTVGRGWGWDAR